MYRQFQQVTWPIKYANPLNKQHQSKTSLTVKLSRQHFYRGYKIWQRNRISMPKCKHYVLSPVTSTTLKDYTGSKVTNYKHYFSFTTLLSMSHLVTMKNPPEKTHQTVLKDIRNMTFRYHYFYQFLYVHFIYSFQNYAISILQYALQVTCLAYPHIIFKQSISQVSSQQLKVGCSAYLTLSIFCLSCTHL